MVGDKEQKVMQQYFEAIRDKRPIPQNESQWYYKVWQSQLQSVGS